MSKLQINKCIHCKFKNGIIEGLFAENERLKKGFGHGVLVELEQVDTLKDEVKELKAEIKRLKDKLQAVNDDYNNDTKVHNEYADGLLSEIKELKADNKRLYQEHKECREDSVKHYPKEYKAEASEYFHHNPQADKVIFYMLDNNEGCIDYDVLEQYEIACINNDNV